MNIKRLIVTPLVVISLVAIFLTLNSHALAETESHLMTENLYPEFNPFKPTLAQSGTHSVGVTTVTIDGPNLLENPEGRRLTLEVWYPTHKKTGAPDANYSDVTRSQREFRLQGQAYRDAGNLTDKPDYPLVILSHGYTGYRSMMFYLGEHLASHGYVVASIDHTDSTNKEIDFANNAFAGFHSTLLHRSRDQHAVLEYVANHSSRFGANADQATVVGYSMGGYGALNTVGACYQFSDTTAATFGFDPNTQSDLLRKLATCNAGRKKVDQRWKAMIALAPWGGEQQVLTGLDKLRVPSLFIAGKDDDVSGYEHGVKKLYDQTGAEHKYLMVYENARHNIAPHPAPNAAYENELALGHYLEPSWNTQHLNYINQHMTLAFLNCHVKGDNNACSMLPSTQSIVQTKQSDGALSPAWPGFKDRFGLGVLFYRNTN